MYMAATQTQCIAGPPSQRILPVATQQTFAEADGRDGMGWMVDGGGEGLRLEAQAVGGAGERGRVVGHGRSVAKVQNGSKDAGDVDGNRRAQPQLSQRLLKGLHHRRAVRVAAVVRQARHRAHQHKGIQLAAQA